MIEPNETVDSPNNASFFSRFGRQRKAPKRFDGFTPHALNSLPAHIPRPLPPPSSPSPPPDGPPEPSTVDPEELPSNWEEDSEPSQSFVDTEPNGFGVFRRYFQVPASDPEDLVTLDTLCDSPELATPDDPNSGNPLRGFGTQVWDAVEKNIFAPFLNATVFRLMHWFYSGSNLKSVGELNRLVNDVLKADDFDLGDLADFNADRELKRLDAGSASSPFTADDGWREASVKIAVPMEKKKYKSEDDAPRFTVPGLIYRPLLELIKSAYEDPIAAQYHFVPFKMYWKRPQMSQASADTPTSPAASPSPAPHTPDASPAPDDAESDASWRPDTPSSSSSHTSGSSTSNQSNEYTQIYTDIFNSNAMLDEDARMRAQPRHPQDDDDLEYAIAPVLAYSDSTRLASFGTHSLHPIYLFIGSLSKYIRTKPNSFAAHHLAYIPSLPDSFQDFYTAEFGVAASAAVLRYCRTALFHEIWLFLLDEKFMEAYEFGFKVFCGDGRWRQLFPRFFCYIADYPEK